MSKIEIDRYPRIVTTDSQNNKDINSQKLTMPYVEYTTNNSSQIIGAKCYFETSTPVGCFSNFQNLASVDFSGCINLTKISNHSFQSCVKLIEIILPDSVIEIDVNAFYKCTYLDTINLENIKYIRIDAFADCKHLGNINLHNIISIETGGFSSCSNIRRITIGPFIQTVMRCFNGCSSLNTVTFEGTPTSIVNDAFNNCVNLLNIYVPWAENEVANAPWGATNATIHYNSVV